MQLIIPVILITTYLLLLTKPSKTLPSRDDDNAQSASSGNRRIKFKMINWTEKKYFVSHIKYIPHLMRYTVPLFCVYISEYMINQGIFELLYYENTTLGTLCLTQQTQYRW